MKQYFKSQAGISLVGTIITIALTVVVFTGLITAIQYSARLTADSAVRVSAMSLANLRLEYFRSLPYNQVGTTAGFPSGVIPQTSIIEHNGITFTERVLVDFIDDPADGLAGSDSNHIITDYKKLKMELLWEVRGVAGKVSYVSNIVPVSVETNEGGGALNVEVDNADGSPLVGAEVRVTNFSIPTTTDITRYTGPDGIAYFIVPAGGGYHASATMAGYSLDKTYESSVSNPNPSPGSFTVVESLITNQSFKIGELSDMKLSTFSSLVMASSTVPFTDGTGLYSTSSVRERFGRLELEEALGVYETSGTAVLQQIIPTAIVRWEKAVIVGSLSANTDYRIRFYTGTTTTYALVPEADLPGNTAGFVSRFVDLSALDVSTYPDLTVEVSLTGDGTATPQIDDIAIYYRESEARRANVNLSVTGKKTVGTNGGAPVFKNLFVTNSGAGGEVTLSGVEFDDEYTVLNNSSLVLASACANTALDFSQADLRLDQRAGIDTELELLYVNSAGANLLVTVETNFGELLPGALVTLSRPGFSATTFTDTCGQAFFPTTAGNNADYQISVSRAGYNTTVVDPYEVASASRQKVILNSL